MDVWRSAFIFPPHKVTTTSEHINHRFNDGQYWIRTELGGEFEKHYIYSKPPREDSDFEPGTISQMIVYHQAENFQARVHQMLLPGEETTPAGLPRLAGYGEPDCKELVEDDTHFRMPTPKTPKAIRRRNYHEE